MSADVIPFPEDPSVPQRRAADPAASVWVAASAGTGKTKVLTDRVLALLLAGTRAERILCLTYTRAAAAEMAIRVQTALGDWAVCANDELDGSITKLTGKGPDDAMRARARGLFGRVLDCPGGLKIQTIHAFCESLLRRFPVEAGLAPHFQVLDETEAKKLLADARDEVLARATGAGPGGADDALAQAVARVAGRLTADDFDKLMQKLIDERGRIGRLLAARGSLDGAVAALCRILGVGREETEADAIRAACAEGAADRAALRAAAVAMADGTDAEKKRGATLSGWLAADTAGREAQYAVYAALFLTQDGAVRKTLLTKTALDGAHDPDGTLRAMEREASRLLAVRERCLAIRTAGASIAALTIGAALIDAYSGRKTAQARLDYDDLILETRGLLSSRDAADWVLYKLDGGIDHVLVDEAQDTSPDQWDVIRRLTGEFFAGLGAREARMQDRPDDEVLLPRTVFAVGDAKQSIYSFQNADPRGFAETRGHYQAHADSMGAEFRDVELHHSFRSTEPVLEAVDSVFAAQPARDGVAEAAALVHHVTQRRGQAGLVELWPAVAPAEEIASRPWSPDPDPDTGGTADARLARLLAEKIESWINVMDLPSRGRKLQAGDVLVLVRTRTRLVDALVRSLKRLDIGVAGVDRMKLADELAVQDLVALGRFLLLPEDDYTLACVLKGPYAGLDDDDLLALAPGREGSLWAALTARAGEKPKWLAAHDLLSGLLARTDFTRPFELFSAVLDEDDGRARLIARLGDEAEDPVNEFLELALAYERSGTATLQGFLDWFEGGQSEIKRDLEQAERDEVRIMTVHGAKGLQAPVVILPDTMTALRPPEGPYWLDDAEVKLPLWAPRARDLAPVAARLRADAQAAQEEEYHRLLYVAMTRAEDALYVAGWHGRTTPPAGCWYNLVAQGLEAIAGTEAFTFADPVTGAEGQGLRFLRKQTDAPDRAAEKTQRGAVAAQAAPWDRRPTPAEDSPPRPMAPSMLGEEPPVLSPVGGDAAGRFLKGRLVHGLLELLPEVPVDNRRAAAERFLARPSLGLDAEAREDIATETLAMLDDPAFAPLFAPGSLAEVPLTGRAAGVVISGQIDRLVVTDDAVLIVDYKTARPIPASPDAVAPAYLTQMALYREALRSLFPDRPVTCALVYTAGPVLMALPDTALDAALPTV